MEALILPDRTDPVKEETSEAGTPEGHGRRENHRKPPPGGGRPPAAGRAGGTWVVGATVMRVLLGKKEEADRRPKPRAPGGEIVWTSLD